MVSCRFYGDPHVAQVVREVVLVFACGKLESAIGYLYKLNDIVFVMHTCDIVCYFICTGIFIKELTQLGTRCLTCIYITFEV